MTAPRTAGEVEALSQAEREALDFTHALACHYDCSGKCSEKVCICRTGEQWAKVERILADRLAQTRTDLTTQLTAARDTYHRGCDDPISGTQRQVLAAWDVVLRIVGGQ